MEEVAENQENNTPDNNGRLTVDEVDIDFLPIIYEIIKGYVAFIYSWTI